MEQILRDTVDGYGASTVTGPRCNDGINPVIKQDNSFPHDSIVDGTPRRIAVVR
ncbi:MAG: hypothetical protein R2763_01305 [Mycobacterium sp.]